MGNIRRSPLAVTAAHTHQQARPQSLARRGFGYVIGMTDELKGKKIGFLMANSGVEQIELTTPWERIEAAGGQPVLLAPETGEVQAFHGDVNPGDTFTVGQAVGSASSDDFAAVVLPGGTTNPDSLRMDEAAVEFVRSFAEGGKPVAAICHGPWTLVETGRLGGKTLTSWPSLQSDLRNAGATWVDEEVSVCRAEGWTLITSRKPDDLDAFGEALVKEFANALT